MDEQHMRDALTKISGQLDLLREAVDQALSTLDGDEVVHVPGQGDWTKTMLAQLWDASRHSEGVRKLFWVLVERAGQEVTFSELIGVTNLDERAQSGSHIVLSRAATKVFGRKTWPFEARQGPPNALGTSEMIYKIDPTIARWFHSLN